LRGRVSQPLDTNPVDFDPPCLDYFEHEGRQGFRTELVAAMGDAGIDAVVYPSWTNSPAHRDRAD
jgi:hypothetical protein